MRYGIYARKSSEEDERQQASLPDQIAALQEKFGQRTDMQIVRVLEEARSAKEPNTRPVFAELIKLLDRGEIDGILCWSIDRLSRNPVDSGLIAWQLQKNIIKSIRTFEREYLPEDNAVILALETSMANQYIRELSRNVKRGLHRKAEKGWYPGKAKVGYRNKTDRDDQKIIAIDEPRFTLLRRAFDLLLTGGYSAQYVFYELNSWGFTVRGRGGRTKPLSRSSFYRLLTDPFYTGQYWYCGELHKGNHQPMISAYEFDLVQSLVGRTLRLTPVASTFAYGCGLIACGVCGCTITAERKKKIYKLTQRIKTYDYYHCTGRKGCKGPSVTGDWLDTAFTALVDAWNIGSDVVPLIHQVITDFFASENQNHEVVGAEQHSKLRDSHRRLDALTEMRLAGELSAEEYLAQKNKYWQSVHSIETEFGRRNDHAKRIQQSCIEALDAVTDIRSSFSGASAETKRTLLSRIAERYVLTLGTLSYRLHPAVEAFVTLELPKKSKLQVQRELAVPNSPMKSALWDAIRKLLSGTNDGVS
ncbi:MAG: recombinase family protein [Fimbriimonadales bacterium]